MTDLTELLRSAEPLTEPGFDAHDVARRVHRRSRRRTLATVTSAAAAIGVIAVLGTGPLDAWRRPSSNVVLSQPDAAPFVGAWVSTDTDGSSQTMDIVRTGEAELQFVLRDELATTCAGAPATMTGALRPETDERLVSAQPNLTCDDGSVPRIGAPPQAELANFTLDLVPTNDTFVDSFGVVWRRGGSPEEPATSGGLWPQSTLEEVRAAQELADAGDPDSTWQLDPNLAAYEAPWDAEIFSRFIAEELGWEQFTGAPFAGYMYDDAGGGGYDVVMFIRCAPGQTNPHSPLYAEAPPEMRRCAPTIDDLTYETVGISVSQPDRRGPSGIWVVDAWRLLQPKTGPRALYDVLDPDYLDPRQVEQVIPPSGREVRGVLEAFLQARVDGKGAEPFLLREPDTSRLEDVPVPLLYATTSGAPYERSEINRVQGPVWPSGRMEYRVRLIAEGGTVVEQYFHVVRGNGQLGIVYGHSLRRLATTEDGESVPVRFTEFGGVVSFIAAPPLIPRGDGSTEIAAAEGDGRIVLAVNPSPYGAPDQGCGNPRPATDAEALARSITDEGDVEVAGTSPVSIAGVQGLQIDATLDARANLCYGLWSPDERGDADWRLRLFLLDHPDEQGVVLTIAILAPKTEFEAVVEQSTPIIDSLEFHPAD